MNVDVLRNKVEAAKVRVEKCKGTIERHEKQLEKKVETALKLGCNVRGLSHSEVEAYKNANRDKFSNEQFWAVVDVTDKFDDIKGARSKLADAELVLQNWEDKLSKAIEQDKLIEGRCPEVIKKFLEQWKVNCTLYYESKYTEWPSFVEELRNEEKQARIECLREVAEYGAAQFVSNKQLESILWARTSLFKPAIEDDVKIAKLNNISEKYAEEWARYCENKDGIFADSNLHNVYPSSLMDAYLKSLNLDWKGINSRKRDFGGELLLKMVEFRDEKKAFDYLDMALEEEKKVKILDLMNRIERITGKIVDAGFLRIGLKGDLEGVIVGEKGKAKINTIGAGGYNIQCYHYRTLIHEYKDKGVDDLLAKAQKDADEYNKGSRTSCCTKDEIMR